MSKIGWRRSVSSLDEIGDLPLELQSKLLRVLQEGEFERLSSPKTIKVDVHVIADTNRDLENIIEQAVVNSQGNKLELGDWLPKAGTPSKASHVPTVEEIEREPILKALEMTNWRVSFFNLSFHSSLNSTISTIIPHYHVQFRRGEVTCHIHNKI